MPTREEHPTRREGPDPLPVSEPRSTRPLLNLPEVVANVFYGNADLRHRLAQLSLGAPKLLGPVADLIRLVDVDAGAVLGTAVLQIVRHDFVMLSDEG